MQIHTRQTLRVFHFICSRMLVRPLRLNRTPKTNKLNQAWPQMVQKCAVRSFWLKRTKACRFEEKKGAQQQDTPKSVTAVPVRESHEHLRGEAYGGALVLCSVGGLVAQHNLRHAPRPQAQALTTCEAFSRAGLTGARKFGRIVNH